MQQAMCELNRLPPATTGPELPARLHGLHAQQKSRGVIRQDYLDQIQDMFVPDPQDASRCLGFSLNEARINRPQPKPGGPEECALCEDVIARKRPDQVALPVVMPSGDTLLVLENPFPLVRGGHATISTPCVTGDPHPGQSWRRGHHAASLVELRRRVEEIGVLAAAGARIVWNNSIGSGASIDHYHHQLLQWPHAQPPPLLSAIERVQRRTSSDVFLLGPPDYPVSAAVAVGTVEAATVAIAELAAQWLQGDTADLTTTLLALPRAAAGGIALVFVPRDPRREKVDGLTGSVAAYEICGVLVLSSAADKERMQAGHYGYTGLWRILESVQDAACRESVEKLF